MIRNAEFVFLAKWLKSPLRVASITPSSTQLAKAMAAALPAGDGLVVELGGGTGPITAALLHAGIAPHRLLVIERDPHFCRHLLKRFAGINLVCGDAFQLRSLVEAHGGGVTIRAVVSGLPMLPMSASVQARLMRQATQLLGPGGAFIQFSYGRRSPLKQAVASELGLSADCMAQVWRNMPPAKVWAYRALQTDLRAQVA